MAVATPRSSTATGNEPTTIEPRRRRFTVDEYHRMGEVGILTEDEPVELIRGEVVQMSPIGGPHIRRSGS